MSYHGTRLKLEVEEPPARPNLIKNATGELGGWNYITPIVGTWMEGDPVPYIEYKSQGATANGTTGDKEYFETDWVPVSPGDWVSFGAECKLPTTTSPEGDLFAWVVHWFGSESALINEEEQITPPGPKAPGSGYTIWNLESNIFNRVGAPPVQVPAGSTVAVKYLVFFGLTGGGAPIPDPPTLPYSWQFQEVTIIKGATAAELKTLERTNLSTNPSFETSNANWVAGSNTTVARSTAVGGATGAGSAAGSLTRTGSTGDAVASQTITVGPGVDFAASAFLRTASGTRTARLRAVYLNSGGGTISTNSGTSITANTTFQRANVTGTTPALTASVRIEVVFLSIPALEINYVDACLWEIGTTSVLAYFDGATTDTAIADYAWTGTTNLSTSTLTNPIPAYVPPATYTDILSSVDAIQGINIAREPLNIGTMNVQLLDADLDPAISDIVRPGRKIRLVGYHDADDEWKNIFSGVIRLGEVRYELVKGIGYVTTEQVRVTILATDILTDLAARKEKYSYEFSGDAVILLENKGVPWLVNGSNDQSSGAGFGVTSLVEGASAVDQLVILRDTNRAYAWVDTDGVVVLVHPDLWATELENLEATYNFQDDVGATLSYEEIDASMNTSDVINHVRFKVLQGGTGEPVELDAGPYKNRDSIREWGEFVKEFTISLASFTDVSDHCDALAADILAENDTPEFKANAIAFSGTYAKAWEAILDCDLYTRVGVEFLTRIDQNLRITKIEHQITSTVFRTFYGFTIDGATASPQIIDSTSNVPASTPANTIYIGNVAICWGAIDITGSTVSSSIYWQSAVDTEFPITFDSAPIVVLTSAANTTIPVTIATKVVTTTGFSWRQVWDDHTAHSGPLAADWVAIGIRSQ